LESFIVIEEMSKKEKLHVAMTGDDLIEHSGGGGCSKGVG